MMAMEGEGFVVFQQHVVAWLVALDQIVFKQQGVFFRFYNNIFDIHDFGYQQAGFVALLLLVEVGADAPLQVFGLAYIYNSAFFVKVLVRSGRLRQIVYNPHESLQPRVVFCFFHSSMVSKVVRSFPAKASRPCSPSMRSSIRKLT